MPRFGDAGAERLPGQLTDRFDKTERAAGGACLPHRQLAAGSIERKRAFGLKVLARMKSGPSPLPQKPDLKLQHIDHRVVVIGFEKIDVVRPYAGLFVEFIAVQGPTAAILDRIVRKGIVPFDRAKKPREGRPRVSAVRAA